MKTVVFDFDGTIADTFPIVLDIFHKVSRRKVVLTSEEALVLRRAALRQIKGLALLKYAKNLSIPLWHVPFLFLICRWRLKGRMQDVMPMPHVHNIIKTLHESGFKLYIMSTNSTENIEVFLKKEHLHSYFEHIYGDVRSSRKGIILKRMINQNILDTRTSWCIGDEDRDIRAANVAGLNSIAVAWGYNSLSQLEAAEPTVLTVDPKVVLETLGVKERGRK